MKKMLFLLLRAEKSMKMGWERVKEELLILICTKDPKYAKLRNSLRDANEKGTRYVITVISSAVGSVMGVEAGVISAFCAVLLHSAAKIGVEAYCVHRHRAHNPSLNADG
jgi:hypothetical protein